MPKQKFYRVREKQKKRCVKCLYEFILRFGGLKLTRSQWKKIIFWFVLDHSLRTITEQTGISLYSVLKATRVLRGLMLRDIPEVFEKIVEVDETYLGGQKKNKRKLQLLREKEQNQESKRGFGTTKQPVFGIRCRSGKIWAELVADIEAGDLIPIIVGRVKLGTRVCSDTGRAYTGLATKGYVQPGPWNTARRNMLEARTTLTALRGSLAISKENLPLRVESKGNIFSSFWKSMFGDIILDRWQQKRKLIV